MATFQQWVNANGLTNNDYETAAKLGLEGPEDRGRWPGRTHRRTPTPGGCSWRSRWLARRCGVQKTDPHQTMHVARLLVGVQQVAHAPSAPFVVHVAVGAAEALSKTSAKGRWPRSLG